MGYRIATIVLPVLLLAWSAAAQCGDPNSGSCCEATFTPGCDDAECCEAVCAVQPICCLEWTLGCVNLAVSICGNCGSCGHIAAGDCCTSNGTPYCNNADCCEAVCEIAPSCCDEDGEWDQSCADRAWPLCPELDGCGAPPICGEGAGACCAANGTPGCADEACCNAVSEVDPYCRNVEWDACCANLAIELCSGVPGCFIPSTVCNLESGNCCQPNGTPGCNDAQCCNLICSMDSFCCDVEWDQICANLANELCAGKCLPKPPPLPAAFSCQGNCGEAAVSGCWCDEACCSFGDCCEDKGQYCQGCLWGLGPGPVPSSGCFGNCGGSDHEFCWCDEMCFENGDCCGNVCAACPDLAGCEPNPADLTGNGVVGVPDLLALLGNWGECQYERCFVMEPCFADFNHDSAVGVADLLFLLNNWGGG